MHSPVKQIWKASFVFVAMADDVTPCLTLDALDHTAVLLCAAAVARCRLGLACRARRQRRGGFGLSSCALDARMTPGRSSGLQGGRRSRCRCRDRDRSRSRLSGARWHEARNGE